MSDSSRSRSIKGPRISTSLARRRIHPLCLRALHWLHPSPLRRRQENSGREPFEQARYQNLIEWPIVMTFVSAVASEVCQCPEVVPWGVLTHYLFEIPHHLRLKRFRNMRLQEICNPLVRP